MVINHKWEEFPVLPHLYKCVHCGALKQKTHETLVPKKNLVVHRFKYWNTEKSSTYARSIPCNRNAAQQQKETP